jgi:glucosamine 6-phosphate synthetase-like amidotransferase/phosphosugar isomerase protein
VTEHALGAPTVLARLLLASLAERGADSAGFAASNGLTITSAKQSGEVAEFLPHVHLPADAQLAMLHVRDYTKGTPGLEANNHPVRHGPVLCVHNGRIANDDLLFAEFSQQRQEPGMTVDSEAISLLASLMPAEQVPAKLVGSYATAWLDERAPSSMMLLRGNGRPLHVCRRDRSVWFASTHEALDWFAQQLGWKDARIARIGDGTGMAITRGAVEREFHFAVNSYTEEPFGGYEWHNARATALRDQVSRELRH